MMRLEYRNAAKRVNVGINSAPLGGEYDVVTAKLEDGSERQPDVDAAINFVSQDKMYMHEWGNVG